MPRELVGLKGYAEHAQRQRPLQQGRQVLGLDGLDQCQHGPDDGQKRQAEPGAVEQTVGRRCGRGCFERVVGGT